MRGASRRRVSNNVNSPHRRHVEFSSLKKDDVPSKEIREHNECFSRKIERSNKKTNLDSEESASRKIERSNKKTNLDSEESASRKSVPQDNCSYCIKNNTHSKVLTDQGHKHISAPVRSCQNHCTNNERKVDKSCMSGASNTGSVGIKKRERVQKQYVRHSEPGICADVVVERIHSHLPLTERNETHQNVERGYNARYAVPELYSSLTTVQSINDKRKCGKKGPSLDPSTLKLIDKMASKKLNFSLEDQLFKDLIDLNISDVFFKKSACGRPFHRKHPRDEIPNLPNIFQPTFRAEYTNYKDVTLRRIGKMKHYNGFAVSQRASGWEISEV